MIYRFASSLPHLLTGSLLACSVSISFAASVDDNLTITANTNQAAEKSQNKIDQLSRETEQLLNEYKKLLHNAEYQQAYSDQLQVLKDEQEVQMEALSQQINEIKVTQQRIMPLMHSMAETLQQFVLLDLPFHQEQRLASVVALKQQLKSATLSTPAKFRSVWELYQIESDYSRTLDSWRGPVTINGETYSVEFLRIGRLALYYRSLDGEYLAFWNTNTRDWQSLDKSFERNIQQGIRVASNQLAPRLLNLPLLSELTELTNTSTDDELTTGGAQ